MPIPVSEAARQLEMHPGTVRRLLARGDVAGEKVGGRWLVDEHELQRLKADPPRRGRRMSPRSAWALLRHLSGLPVKGLSRSEWARLRSRAEQPQLLEPRALSARASVHHFYGHPRLVENLRSEERVVLGGHHAAAKVPDAVVEVGHLDGYVRGRDLSSVVSQYALQPSSPGRANVRLRVPVGEWPFGDGRIAPAAVGAIDLLDSGDERSRRAARQVLTALGS